MEREDRKVLPFAITFIDFKVSTTIGLDAKLGISE